MYRKKDRAQPEFVDFYLPFGGKLRADNRWVKLAELMPWEQIEERYARLFDEDTGAPALSARIAVGSLIIKEKLRLTDEETVEQIRENPYLQYFLGYEAYRDEPPFDASMMVHFRRRLGEQGMSEINDLVLRQAGVQQQVEQPESEEQRSPDSGSGGAGGGSANRGKLLLDASCTPADIRYPTDLSLLNEAREKSEHIIDEMHAPDIGRRPKPRTYRQRARKEYLAVAKKRSPNRKTIRKARGKQLRYLRRNLSHIRELADRGRLALLGKRTYRTVLVVSELYRQQRELYEQNARSIPGRIVSISQPHVRPIVRGKAGRPVEFGAKISIASVEGYVYLDRLSWDPYHEAGDLAAHLAAYRARYGCYPESVHVDQIYRTRENRRLCKRLGIRISGPPLGRPAQDGGRAARRQQRIDERDRIPVEGSLGRGKRRFSLARIMAKCADTAEASIATAFLVMNLETLAERLLRLLRSAVATLCAALVGRLQPHVSYAA